MDTVEFNKSNDENEHDGDSMNETDKKRKKRKDEENAAVAAMADEENGSKQNCDVHEDKRRKTTDSKNNDDEVENELPGEGGCNEKDNDLSGKEEEEEEDEEGEGREEEESWINAVSAAWDHYRAYVDSLSPHAGARGESNKNGKEEDNCDNDDSGNDEESNKYRTSAEVVGGGGGGSGDIDEILELIEILSPHVDKPEEGILHQHQEEEDDDAIIADITTAAKKVSTIIAPSAEQVSSRYCNIQSLLSVLLSMSYLHLGDYAISQTLESSSSYHNHHPHHEDDDDKREKMQHQNGTGNEAFEVTTESPQYYIHRSLLYFPYNAAALSMFANYLRMNQFSPLEDICALYECAATLAAIVRRGAIRILEEEEEGEKEGGPNSDGGGGGVKEWVELLLLDGVCGAEYIGDDEFDDDEEEEDGDDKPKEKEAKKQQNRHCDDAHAPALQRSQEDEKMNGNTGKNEPKCRSSSSPPSAEDQFSFATFEATSSFMAAMLHSTIGRHDDALRHLRKFDLTHRIHPNVWDIASTSGNQKRLCADVGGLAAQEENRNNGQTISERVNDKDNVLFEPRVFRVKKDRTASSMTVDCDNVGGARGFGGILPTALYQRMCQIFAPNSQYWKESGYDHRGYYSYFLDLPPSPPSDGVIVSRRREFPVSNVIEEVIVHHLLPLAQSVLPKDGPNKEDIVGAEWWAHTRPVQANLGHQLHFDTDEALLAQEGQITHPIVSSVLYLTGGDEKVEEGEEAGAGGAGSTIVLNQTPDAAEVADRAWFSTCRNNTYTVFPGNLLHGVLPCPGRSMNHPASKLDGKRGTAENFDKKEIKSKRNRLTFMVGFWTRRVPDKMKTRTLYGPCGPLPPASTEHTWVQDICKGYERVRKDIQRANMTDGDKKQTLVSDSFEELALPEVRPAWECIKEWNPGARIHNDERSCATKRKRLELPKALDHRFFVRGAPECFRDSLLNKEECF